MTYRGHMENGVVVLDEEADLPDGAKVMIDVSDFPAIEIHPDVRRFSGVLPKSTDAKGAYYEGHRFTTSN